MKNIEETQMNSFRKLKTELYKIQCRNWIENRSGGTGAAGLTLEKLLGKETDRKVLPDYEGIEIKTVMDYSKYPMHLFSCALDSKPLEMKKLLETGGYPDKTHPEFKVFNVSINSKEYKKVGNYKYLIKVNYEKEVVELIIKHIYLKGFDDVMSWSFCELKSRLETKLSYLALVNTKKYTLKETIYFKYYSATFYVLKEFDDFLKLIEDGIISVCFKLTYDHSAAHFGEYMDKGTGFEINYNDLPLLFNRIEVEHLGSTASS